jgi:hypothetical protein
MTAMLERPYETYVEASARAQHTEAEADALRQATATRAALDAIDVQRAQAAAAADIADGNAKAEARLAKAAKERKAREEELAAEAETKARREAAAKRWRIAAITFAIVCAVLALPVQVAAFWDPHAWWMVAAPAGLESGAWVVQFGAAAAVEEHRPHWHYRLIAWVLALVAAGINLSHGLEAFGVATAVGTAFASIAGPGVWDLHEHGRIRTRDGRQGWRKRRAEAKTAHKAAAEATAKAEAKRQADEARHKAVLAGYESEWPEVYKHARRIAAALSETTVTPQIWRRAWDDMHGTAVGDTAEMIAARVAAKAAAKKAAQAPDGTPAEGAKPQVESQMPPAEKRPAKDAKKGADGRRNNGGRPPIRRAGDTAPYHQLARVAARHSAA